MSRSMDTLPTESDINVYDSLDERAAVDRFLGKSLGEVEDRCQAGFALDVTQDLYWIGPRAFIYYVRAVVNYLKSDSSQDDPDAVNGFAGMVEFRFDELETDLKTACSVFVEAIDHVLQNYDKFAIDSGLYGDLRPRYVALRDRIRPMMS